MPPRVLSEAPGPLSPEAGAPGGWQRAVWTATRAGSARSRVRGVSSATGGAAQLEFRKPDPFHLLEFFPCVLRGKNRQQLPG